MANKALAQTHEIAQLFLNVENMAQY